MQDKPGAPELLRAVVSFLREVAVPALPPRESFDARVAANALELVARDITLGADSSARECERLAALVGDEGALEERNARLALAIRDGAVPADDTDVAEHLWATTLAKLAVDQPRYSTYLRARGARCTDRKDTG